jgi:glutamine synthetase
MFGIEQEYIDGTNAEVMMGQWEFQIGILPTPRVGDHLC